MKKILVTSVVSFLFPLVSFAAFNQNLSYGMSGSDIYQLQDILIDENCLGVSSPTGYFGLLTLNAVKCYQSKNGLPNTGYVGVMTRGKLNSRVADVTQSSVQAQVTETGTTTVLQDASSVACPTGFNCIPNNQISQNVTSEVVGRGPVIKQEPSILFKDQVCRAKGVAYVPYTIKGGFSSARYTVTKLDPEYDSSGRVIPFSMNNVIIDNRKMLEPYDGEINLIYRMDQFGEGKSFSGGFNYLIEFYSQPVEISYNARELTNQGLDPQSLILTQRGTFNINSCE